MATTEVDEATREMFRRTNRSLLIAAAVLAVVILAVVAVVQVNANSAENDRVHGYYCTLEPLDPQCD